MRFHIDPDIRRAETLPAQFYRSPEVFEALRERVMARSWQWIGDTGLVPLAGMAQPFALLEQHLDEPMLLLRDLSGELRCLSNVCTHRANLLLRQPASHLRQLTCGYHGRRFGLDGRFRAMPEFGEALDFPRPCDDLRQFPLEAWGPFLFTGIAPAYALADSLAQMSARVGFLPLHELRHRPDWSRDYLVQAHWALYCDNYLEGFHIPFVHADLNGVLDYGSYRTELFAQGSLQIGYAKPGEMVFDLPPGHPDEGQLVGAYYFWLFPNMMFNFYPWGLSINIVRPLGPERTRVSFISYVLDESLREGGAGAGLDKVEREDEYVVEGVQRGLRGRSYGSGRFSPSREQGVHHFHRLLADWLGEI